MRVCICAPIICLCELLSKPSPVVRSKGAIVVPMVRGFMCIMNMTLFSYMNGVQFFCPSLGLPFKITSCRRENSGIPLR